MCKLYNYKVPEAWYWLMEKDFEKYAKGEPVFVIFNNDRLTYNSPDLNSINANSRHTFVIINNDKIITDNLNPHLWGSWTRSDLSYLDEGKIVFRDKYYTVWRYDSYEHLQKLIGK